MVDSVLLGIALLDKWKKKRAANKAQREEDAQREQKAWREAEAQKEAQREQRREAEAQKEAQREQEARQEHERREQQRREQQRRERTAQDHKGSSRQWWEVLGVSRSASMDEIKRAYHSMLRMYHPDRVNGLGPEFIRMAEDRTRELNRAFDEAKRAVWSQ
jgi:DnaJ-domain-containing protein 1